VNAFLKVPVESVISLSPEQAITMFRMLFRSECQFAKLGPDALTISGRIAVADGGIDAQVDAPAGAHIPSDCLFKAGLNGFQIKSGTAFKPWTIAAMRSELINGAGALNDEVRRLTNARGRYIVLCTGHDLTARQRNDARSNIIKVLVEAGVSGYDGLVDVLGASQIAEYTERYPGTAALLARDQIQDGLTLDEWQQDSQLGNEFKGSPDQLRLIEIIRSEVIGDAKHIRVLGEPGLGKTRVVLEALKVERIAPSVLYFPHGSQFSRSLLFRQLLKSRHEKPLVLVIDELPDSEMAEVWTHLKPRCGFLKIVSLDHGKDESHDAEISRHEIPKLADDSIKKILADRIGESRELDRWVAICEGSPK
jgi:hypothetical protein